jgi:hypothetical protein
MKSKKEGSFVDRGSEYEPSLTVYGILQTHALSSTPLFAKQQQATPEPEIPEIKRKAGTSNQVQVGTLQTNGNTILLPFAEAAAAEAKRKQQSSVTDTMPPQIEQREDIIPRFQLPDDKELEESRIELQELPEIAEITVYVSCLIRTWMTAILLYQTYETIHLIIAPYLKEEGDTAGNLPLPLREQIHKMNEFLKYVDFLQLNKPKTIYLRIAPFDATQEPILLHTFSDASTEKDESVYAFEYTCDISKYISGGCPSSRLPRSYKTEIAHNWQKTQNLLKHVRLNLKKKDVDFKQLKKDYKDAIEVLRKELSFESKEDTLSIDTKQTETSSAEENLYLKVDLQQFIQWAQSTKKTTKVGLYDIRAVAHGKMMRKFFSPKEELKKKLKHENSWSIDYDYPVITIHHGIQQPNEDQVSKYIRSSCEPLCLFSYGNYAPEEGYVWDDDQARITRCSDKMSKSKSKSAGGSRKTSPLKSRRRAYIKRGYHEIKTFPSK